MTNNEYPSADSWRLVFRRKANSGRPTCDPRGQPPRGIAPSGHRCQRSLPDVDVGSQRHVRVASGRTVRIVPVRAMPALGEERIRGFRTPRPAQALCNPHLAPPSSAAATGKATQQSPLSLKAAGDEQGAPLQPASPRIALQVGPIDYRSTT